MGVGSHGAQPSRRQPQFATAAEIWRRALAQLRNTLPRNTYETWFASARAVELRAGVLILSVDNIYKRETLVTNYYSTISVAVAEVLGHRIEIEVEVNTDPPAPQTPDTTLAGAAAPASSVARTRPVLKSSYTLSSFVVGPSNQIAHAAASAVAENPGRSHNPLFIYGGSGLGKTHLLQAIAHITLEGSRTHCIPMESYIREYVEAVRTGDRSDFQAKYEQADVLLIDDVQALVGKERTQEEFFNLFNALYLAGKQLVFSCDTSPRRLRGLQERLVTRLEWGLVVELLRPDLELRLAILRQKCLDRGVRIADDVLRLLAQHASRNVRELEGVLNHVELFANVERSPITTNTALRALSGYHFDDIERVQPTIGEIINAACETTGLAIDAFTSKRRDQRAARARHLVMYLAREDAHMSYPEIGSHLGGRDHTTVLHGYRKIHREVEGEPAKGLPPKAETQRMVSDIRSRLRL